ncbi:MAG: hypothetical protein PHT17_06560 [Proteiniphilum sp.]|nr:hypothetical protein [Proteiniphilum sp.]
MKKNNSKRYLIISFLVIFFLFLEGCTVDPIEQETDPADKRLVGNIIDGNRMTRTAVIDQYGIKAEVRWEADDRIGVFGKGGGSNLPFTAGVDDILENGKKARFRTDGSMPSGEVTAYYPYQEEATINTQGELTLSFPATQPYNLVERVSQPYAPANFMAGKGSASGIGFRNLFALLKVGFRGTEGDRIRKIHFRDLSGKPVSGTFTVAWSDGIPDARFPESGSGTSLTLTVDCGEGVLLDGALHHFYLFIPPRQYSKGFEVKLVMDDGSEVIKTIGTTSGKKIERSLVYPVGETANATDEAEYKLQEDVTLVDADRMEYIVDVRVDTWHRWDDSHKVMFEIHDLEMIVKKEFEPIMGEVLLFDTPSQLLPEGYRGRITYMTDYPDSEYIQVTTSPITDITEVFEELSLGEPIWNEDGSLNEEGGVELELGAYLSRVETPDGEAVSFTRNGSQIELSMPATRAGGRKNYNYSSGNMNFTLEPGDNSEIEVSASMDLSMRLLVGIFDKKLHYFHASISPDIQLSADMSIQVEADAVDKSFHLLTAYFAPIPVPPLTIVPVIHFYGVAGVGGEAEIRAGMSYSAAMDLGFSYNSNEGFRTRSSTRASKFSENGLSFPGGELSTNVHTTAGIRVDAGIKVWGVMEALCSADARMKLGFYWDVFEQAQKMILNTENNIRGSLTTLGGVFNYETDALTLEGDPIWERYFTPQCDLNASDVNLSADSTQVHCKFKVMRHLMERVQIGAILYRGEPYGYYGNGKHPYGFKPTEEIMKVDFGRSYIGSGMSRREDDKIVFDDYEVFEHTFPFTPEPGGFYGIVPARGGVGTGLFAQMSVNILDYYGLRFFTFRGRAVEE